jgi:hypothetical protein
MRLAIVCGLVAAGLGLGAPDASARALYFDVWCEDQGYSKARCDARNPADLAAFEEYWRKVERYEEAYHYDRKEDKRWRDNLNALDQEIQPGPGFSEEERRNR